MTTVLQTEKKDKYLIFRICDDLYGLEVQNLKEVFQAGNILKLPRTSEVLEGIVNLRGYIVSIFNLSILLWGTVNYLKNESATKPEANRNIVLLMTIKGHDVGVLVDQIYSLDTITEFISKDETYFDGKKLQNPALITQIGFLDGRKAVFLLNLEDFLGGFITTTKPLKEETKEKEDLDFDFDQYTLPDPDEPSQEVLREGEDEIFDLNHLNLPENQLIDKFDQEILEDVDIGEKSGKKKKKPVTKKKDEAKKSPRGKKEEKIEKGKETKKIEETNKVKNPEKTKQDDKAK